MYQKSIYQDIFDMVKTSLPDGWKNVVFFIWIAEGCQEIKYYVKKRDGIYVDCFQLGMDKNDMIKVLLRIMNKIIIHRSENWKMMTIQYDNNQECKAFFDYSSACDDYISLVAFWKNTYLV